MDEQTNYLLRNIIEDLTPIRGPFKNLKEKKYIMAASLTIYSGIVLGVLSGLALIGLEELVQKGF